MQYSHPGLATLIVMCLAASSCVMESEDLGANALPVVDGTVSTEGSWPTMVSIASIHSSRADRHWCGGTLIRPDKVMTAAHCFNTDADPGSYEIRIGRINLGTSSGEVVEVVDIQFHPDYDDDTNDHDLAVLTLEDSVVGVTPTRLVSPARMAEIGPGDKAVMMGWGTTSSGGSGSTTLREVSLPIIAVGAACNEETDYETVTENQICIGRLDGGQDTCQGDSGGPAFVWHDGEWFQIGITSWGLGCARPELPGVYTYLPNYLEWTFENVPGGRPAWLTSSQIIAIL